VGLRHNLDRIGNDFARGQRIFHTRMAHSNTIADCYGVKLKSGAACLANRLFDDLSHFIKVNVTRHYLTKAVGNTDKRLVYIGISQSTGMKQAPVRRPLETFFNRVTSHNPASPKNSS
jgi:hypothetical protein